MSRTIFRGVMQRSISVLIQRDPVCVRCEQFLGSIAVRDKQRRAAKIIRRFNLRVMLQQLCRALCISVRRRPMKRRHSHRPSGLHIGAIGEKKLDDFRMRFLAAFNGEKEQWLVVRTEWK